MHISSHFPIQPSLGNIDHGKMEVKDNRNLLLVCENALQVGNRLKKTAEISLTYSGSNRKS